MDDALGDEIGDGNRVDAKIGKGQSGGQGSLTGESE